MKFLLFTFISFTLQIMVLSVGTDSGLPNDSSCTLNAGCDNPCKTRGDTCCFCDKLKNTGQDACFCCPKGNKCCPIRTWSGVRANCCPNDHTCTDDGRCTKNVWKPAESAVGSCAYCRQDTKIRVTGDDKVRCLIDGVEKKLSNGENWMKADEFTLPSTAKQITLCGYNDYYKAGFLIDAVDSNLLNNAEWRCCPTTERCVEDYGTIDFNDPKCNYGVTDEKNNGAGTKTITVDGISGDAYWTWCNNPNSVNTAGWVKYCVCRITIKNNGYGK